MASMGSKKSGRPADVASKKADASARRPGRPALRSAEAYRSALLAAASEVIGEVGPANAKLSAIAARAGVGYGTLYQYFTGRDDLLLQTLLAQSHETELEWERARAIDDPVERIVALCMAPIYRVQAMPAFRDVFVGMTSGEGVAGAAEEANRMYQLAIALFVEAITHGGGLGLFRALDPGMTAIAMMGIPASYLSTTYMPEPDFWDDIEPRVRSVVRGLALSGYSEGD